MRRIGWGPLLLIGAVVVGAVSVGVDANAFGADGLFVSAEVFALTTSTGCNQSGLVAAPVRAQVDTLDDAWRSASVAAGLSTFRPVAMAPSAPVSTHPTPAAFPPSGVQAAVSLRDVPLTQLPPFGGPVGGAGVGALASANSNGPSVTVLSTRTLSDCAPYPQSLYGTNAATQTPAWTENAGGQLSINGVLFDFARPVRAFGAWFGDLETRPLTGGAGGTGTPAWVKLISPSGDVLYEAAIPTSTGPAPTDAQCGGPDGNTDGLGCGNQSTRWIGFVAPPGEAVAQVLVTVGDDDSCAQSPAVCNGAADHLSWVGATIAVDAAEDPDPTTTTTIATVASTTTTTTTAPSTTTTTVAPTMTMPATTIDATTSTAPATTTTEPVTTTTTAVSSTTSTEPTATSVEAPTTTTAATTAPATTIGAAPATTSTTGPPPTTVPATDVATTVTMPPTTTTITGAVPGGSGQVGASTGAVPSTSSTTTGSVAGAAAPTVTVDRSTARPGDVLTVRGSGFRAGEQVTADLSPARRVFGPAPADADGTVTFTVTVSSADGLGVRRLVLVGSSGTAIVTFTVYDRATLPATGSDSGPTVRVAVLLLCAGVLASVVSVRRPPAGSRSRRRHPED